MYFVICAVVLFLLLFALYRMVFSSKLFEYAIFSQNPASLKLSVIALASSSATSKPRGNGLDVRGIKIWANKANRVIAILAQNGECFEFENRIYDSFYVMRDKLAELKHRTKSLRDLPHYGGKPRVYLLCRLLVEACGGAVTDEILDQMVGEFNNITPLNYSEIMSLPTCLEYALLEYLANFCEKSVQNNKIRAAAQRDAVKNRIDLSNLAKDSYSYYYVKFCSFQSETVFDGVAAANDISIRAKSDAFTQLAAAASGGVESALKTLSSTKTWMTDEFLLELSPLNQMLCGERVVYRQCSLPTKNVYLYHLERRAKRAKIGELSQARQIVIAAEEQGRDIAEFILPRAGGRTAMRAYIYGILLASAAICVTIAVVFKGIYIALAALFFPSAVAIVVGIAGELTSRMAFRRFLPRINLEYCIPNRVDATTMPDIVVHDKNNTNSICSAMSDIVPTTYSVMSDIVAHSADNCGENSEQRQNGLRANALIVYCGLAVTVDDVKQLFFSLKTASCANPSAHFRYALLLDFAAGDEQQEGDLTLLEQCKKEYEKLERAERFNVFVRRRREIIEEKRRGKKSKFQGWEKKRGAIINLNDYLISGDEDEFRFILGGKPNVDYVITLDSDTCLNCAEELLQIMEHPYNKDRCIVSLSAKTNPYSVSTAFARLMCGALGLDSYSGQQSEANFDLFDSGNYTGKGIYRVRQFNQKLKDFFPDSRILSHDFIEGAVVGCGSAECAVDTFPATFSQYQTRATRWLRGDWQLLPYLFRRVKNRHGDRQKNPISPIARWHIFCNMLFSLLPICALASLILSAFFCLSPVAILVSLGYYLVGILTSIRAAILHKRSPLADFARLIFQLSTLPICAVSNLLAIAVTLVRLATKRRLLEWKVFAHASGRVGVWQNILLAAVLAVPMIFFGASLFFILPPALFILGIMLIFLLDRQYKRMQYLPNSLRLNLLETARQTWSFFVDAQTASSSSGAAQGVQEAQTAAKLTPSKIARKRISLVPDNFQEHLALGFAKRTSPTNIGFSLIAPVCAFELGFISSVELISQIEAVILSIERLEKWHGNLYNWTDTSGSLLHPRYVSSVDNGNLLACLLVAEEYADSEFLAQKQSKIWTSKNDQIKSQKTKIKFIKNAQNSGLCCNFNNYNGSENMTEISSKIADENDRIISLKSRIKRLVDEMDIGKLFDKKRGLLHIGYNDSIKLFDNHYDLLASEAMLTYLVAIGCGKIPKSSFDNLSKSGLRAFGRVVLASWSGGIFEYLMSAIFVDYPDFCLLNRSGKAVVRTHRKAAGKKNLPFWGFSESQFNYTDDGGRYQYRAFGAEKISNSPQPESRVVAPYATFLSLKFDPKNAAKNLENIHKNMVRGQYGFYESCDDGEVIKSFMAHHQGMILASICNYLCGDAIIKALGKNPKIAAAKILLSVREFSGISKKHRPQKPRKLLQDTVIDAPPTAPMRYNILTGGGYSVAHSSDGSSVSIFERLAVSRADSDGLKIFITSLGELSKAADNFVETDDEKMVNTPSYFSDNSGLAAQMSSGLTGISGEQFEEAVSDSGSSFESELYGAQMEAAADLFIDGSRAEPQYFDGYAHDISLGKVKFCRNKTEFEYRTKEFLATQTAIVLQNLSGEARKIHIKNLTNRSLKLEVSSYFSPALCKKMQDLSHKAFSSMSIRTELLSDAIIAHRIGAPLFMAHFFDVSGAKYESNAHNLRFGGGLNSFGAVIFPALSGNILLTIPAGGHAELCVYNLVDYQLDALQKSVRLAKTPIFFSQAQSASTASPVRVDRRDADLLPAFLEPTAALKNGRHRPLVIVECALEELRGRLDSLCEIQKFAEFDVAVAYREMPGYRSELAGQIGYYIEKSGVKNAHAFNTFGDEGEELLSRLKKAVTQPPIYENLGIYRPKKAKFRNAKMPKFAIDYAISEHGFLRDSAFYIDLSGSLPKRPWSNVISAGGMGMVVTESGGGYTFFKNSGTNKLTRWTNEPIVDRQSEGILLEEDGVFWSATRLPFALNDCEYSCVHGFGYSEFYCNYNGILATQTEFLGGEFLRFKRIRLQNFEGVRREIDVSLFLNLVLGDHIEHTKHHINIEQNGEKLIVENIKSGEKFYLFCSSNLNMYAKNMSFYARASVNGNNENSDSFCEQSVQVGIDDTNLERRNLKEKPEFVRIDENNEYKQNPLFSTFFSKAISNPSVVMSAKINVEPYKTEEIVFCIAASNNRNLLCQNSQAKTETKTNNYSFCGLKKIAQTELERSKQYFANLPNIEVKTGEKSLDHFMRWLPYQSLSCRFNARAGFYQAGGAIGFRDQLQDCLGLLHISPNLVRDHIIECAAHQFEEGDVQHWWHPPRMGVRTRISDDMLYLPWVVAEYIRFSGDKNILMQSVPFLRGRRLSEGESDAYFSPDFGESGTLLEHCLRAIFYNKTGENSLVLMGGGDWNDAMNTVGDKGRGESVFGSMFLYFVIHQFLPFVRDSDTRKQLVAMSLLLRSAVEKCWDGRWFLRAFMDDCRILGSQKSTECQIDLLTQAWATLSGIAEKQHALTALKSAADRLIDYQSGIIKLLDPPLKYTKAGYISDYPEGVRENGGQYTHAAVWFVMALFDHDQTEFAFSLLEMLSPISHSLATINNGKGQKSKRNAGQPEKTREKTEYMCEPYVLCGDVYAGQNPGLGGWSWYTGSASWYYKCMIEKVFGVNVRAGKLSFLPHLPQKIKEVSIKYKTDFGVLDITIDNTGVGEWTIFVDRVRYNITHLLISPALTGKKIVVKRD